MVERSRFGAAAPFVVLAALVASAPPAAAASRCANARAHTWKLSAAAARAAMVCEVNRARASHGLQAFRRDRHLARAAGGHARDMARRQYFAHQRPGGPSLGDRLRNARWRGRAAGEAIAWGCGSQASARSTVRAWLASPGHRAILLDGGYDRVGIGVAKRPPASCGPGATWVLDAGRR